MFSEQEIVKDDKNESEKQESTEKVGLEGAGKVLDNDQKDAKEKVGLEDADKVLPNDQKDAKQKVGLEDADKVLPNDQKDEKQKVALEGAGKVLPNDQKGAKQYVGKPKVVYMVFTDGPSAIEKGFKEYFSEKNIPIEYIERDCGGATNIKKCNRFVDEIKTLKPDIVYTWGTPAALAIAGTTDEPNKEKYLWDIPIISGIIANPIASKIVYDLKDTGRNLTGVNHIPDYDSQVSADERQLEFPLTTTKNSRNCRRNL